MRAWPEEFIRINTSGILFFVFNAMIRTAKAK